MPYLEDYLEEKQENARQESAELIKAPYSRERKAQLADQIAGILAIQHVLDTGEYESYPGANSEQEDHADESVKRLKNALLKGIFAHMSEPEMMGLLQNENGTVRSTEGIKNAFLQKTERQEIVTNDDYLPDSYWRNDAEKLARADMEKAYANGSVTLEVATEHLATILAVNTMGDMTRASQEQVKRALDNRREQILNDPRFQMTIKDAKAAAGPKGNVKWIRDLYGKYDKKAKTLTTLPYGEIYGNYRKAMAQALRMDHLLKMKSAIEADPFDLQNARSELATALVLNDVMTGAVTVGLPITGQRWAEVEARRDEYLASPAFQSITDKSREEFAAIFGTYDPVKREFHSKITKVIGAYGSELAKYQKEQERIQREAEEKARREAEEQRIKEEQAYSAELDGLETPGLINKLYDELESLGNTLKEKGLSDLAPTVDAALNALDDFDDNETAEKTQPRIAAVEAVYADILKNEAAREFIQEQTQLGRRYELLMERLRPLVRQQTNEKQESVPTQESQPEPVQESVPVQEEPVQTSEPEQPKQETAAQETSSAPGTADNPIDLDEVEPDGQKRVEVQLPEGVTVIDLDDDEPEPEQQQEASASQPEPKQQQEASAPQPEPVQESVPTQQESAPEEPRAQEDTAAPSPAPLSKKIDDLHDKLWESYAAFYDARKRNGRDLSDCRDAMTADFHMLIAAISLSREPAYANPEQLPEGVDIEAEINKRRAALEDSETYRQAVYGSMEDIVAVPPEDWEDEEAPELLSPDEIMKNFDARMREKQAELDQAAREYGIGTSEKGPNLALFKRRLDLTSEHLDNYIARLAKGEHLPEAEMLHLGDVFTSWMGYVEAANDPRYAGLRRPPQGKRLDILLDETEARAFNKKDPVFLELFRPGREKDVLEMLCGPRETWKDGKPAHLTHDEMKKNLDGLVKAIEDERTRAEKLTDAEPAKQEPEPVQTSVPPKQEAGPVSDTVDDAIDLYDDEDGIKLDGQKRVEVNVTKDVTAIDLDDDEPEEKKAEKESLPKESKQPQEPTQEEMADVEEQLYNAFDSLYLPLYKAYGMSDATMKIAEARTALSNRDFGEIAPEDFKKSVETARKILDTELPDSEKTIADFAREKGLLDDKLMERAEKIAGIDRQAEEKQAADERARKQATKKTAAQWIDDFKRDFREHPEQIRKQPGYPAMQIARIMAARELVGSVRGKASSLNKEINELQIETRAKQLLKTDNFETFVRRLSMPENRRAVEAIFAKKHSHGGELDDEFRKSLKDCPAGRLENDPMLKRWLPTVKQRVEQLQKQAAMAMKAEGKESEYTAAAAEIMLLRKAAGVQRGGKGLNAPIPTMGKAHVSSLSSAVNAYANHGDFRRAFKEPDIKQSILAGHGGAMVEKLEQEVLVQEIHERQDEPQLGK